MDQLKLTRFPVREITPTDGKIKELINADFYYLSGFVSNPDETFLQIHDHVYETGVESGSRIVQIFSSRPNVNETLDGQQLSASRTHVYGGYPTLPVATSPDIEQIRLSLNEELKVPFDTCLVNLYKDGSAKIGMHSDRENERSESGSGTTRNDLVPGAPIASISLGATRHFDVWCKLTAPVQHDRYRIDLAPGSLLVMRRDSQRHYLHGVPGQLRVKEPRINLTFRVTRDVK